MGHSRSGKSTLLNILGLLDQHTPVSYGRTTCIKPTFEAQAARFRNRVPRLCVSIVPSGGVKMRLKCDLALYYQKVRRKDRKRLGLEYLEKWGCEIEPNIFGPTLRRRSAQGQRAIARALVTLSQSYFGRRTHRRPDSKPLMT
jgi:putative ABC transport system ATP-binding protein